MVRTSRNCEGSALKASSGVSKETALCSSPACVYQARKASKNLRNLAFCSLCLLFVTAVICPY